MDSDNDSSIDYNMEIDIGKDCKSNSQPGRFVITNLFPDKYIW